MAERIKKMEELENIGKFTPLVLTNRISRNTDYTAATSMQKRTTPITDFEQTSIERRRQKLFTPMSCKN